MEVFAAVYRAELKSFGVDVVVAAAGNMRTGGPAKTAAALARVADGMTAEQRRLYGQSFNTFAINSFAEYAPEPNPETKKKDVVWFALSDERPLFGWLGQRSIDVYLGWA
jgi:predicted AlkP superfamily phosphohydrolase/phosphomutase